MAKCFASDMAMKVTTDAVQIFWWGGVHEGLSGRALYARRPRSIQIFEGTNQIHRLIIARQLLA